MNDFVYQTVDEVQKAELKVQESKFIAYIFPVKNEIEIKQILNHLRQEHVKARHVCFAYRLSKLKFRFDDDKEPAGTAGSLILNKIDCANLINVLIVVVRYFGGILLGIPGLKKAYKNSAQLVLEKSHIIECNYYVQSQIEFLYRDTNEVFYILNRTKSVIKKIEKKTNCLIWFKTPKNNEAELKASFEKLKIKFNTLE